MSNDPDESARAFFEKVGRQEMTEEEYIAAFPCDEAYSRFCSFMLKRVNKEAPGADFPSKARWGKITKAALADIFQKPERYVVFNGVTAGITAALPYYWSASVMGLVMSRACTLFVENCREDEQAAA